MHRVIYAPRTITEAQRAWIAIQNTRREVLELALMNELAFQLPAKVMCDIAGHPMRRVQKYLEALRADCAGIKNE